MSDIPKPPFGAPCNRCGYCCQKSLCLLGTAVFGDRAGPCPALETGPDGVSTACGLATHPATYDPMRAAGGRNEVLRRGAALHIIDAGAGCDCNAVGEIRNHRAEACLSNRQINRAAEMTAALKVWDL
jgi:hypothetical protein